MTASSPNDPKQLRPLYDIHSRCVALLCDAKRSTIHQRDGQLLAEVDDGAVFSTDGRHIGWLIQGQLYDRKGKLVLANKALGASLASRRPTSLDRKPRRTIDQRETVESMPAFRCDEWADVSGLAFFGPAKPSAPPSAGDEQPYVQPLRAHKTSASSAPPPA